MQQGTENRPPLDPRLDPGRMPRLERFERALRYLVRRVLGANHIHFFYAIHLVRSKLIY